MLQGEIDLNSDQKTTARIMELTDTLDDVFNDVVYDNNAQEVFKKLNALDNQRDLLVSRWVWELIQNARGTAGSQAQLEIEVVLDGGHLSFRHNGSRFKDREIAHLILHGSTKHDPRDIGRFGSGFITTHLISRRVRVRGSLVDGRTFDFHLNREGKDAAELREAMKRSKEQFQTSLGQAPAPVPDPYTTEYTYQVSDSIRPVVVKGIQALHHSAAYIFAFNHMLHRLRIATPEASLIMAKEPLEPIAPNTLRMALHTDGQESKQWLVTTADENVTAAIALDAKDGISSVRLPADIPRLFVAFPLNGTETLCIPLVLNSELFAAREERDGIFLGTSDTPDNEKNKVLFAAGCHCMLSLISLATEKDWANAADTIRLQPFANPAWANEAWLRSQVRKVLIEGFRTVPLLRTISGKLIPPNSAWVPVAQKAASSLNLWQATEPLLEAADLIPRLQDQPAWDSSVKSWIPFLEPSDGTLKEIWTVDRLAGQLEGLKSVAGVTAALRKETAALVWVNHVHALICKAGAFDSFRQKSLIPNERGGLAQIGKLCKDGGIDPELKDIADLLSLSLRAQLVHPEINTPEILAELNVLTEEQVLNQLLDLMRQRVRDNPITAPTQAANIQLFAWLVKKEKTVKLDNFPALTLLDPSDKPGLFVLRDAASPSERPLAPVAQWPEVARSYADLLPDSAILHPRYAEAISDPPQWQTLASNGFLHLGPLYEADSVVQDFLPDEPLGDDELKAKPRSEAPRRRTEITFLSGNDRAIIDRARGSENRALKLLRFILDYVLPADPQAFDEETIKCDNGKDHRFFHANWLTPFRNRIWVPLGKGKSDTPSAESLATLLAQEPELLKRLGEERPSQLLKALGVSPADLMLRSVGRNDPERVSLIQSLSVITSAAGNDPEKVKALAGAIQQDPEVLNLVEERRARQATVKRNQALGDLVERLFVEAFQGTGLVPKRTGPGHDYRILPAAGEEEDAGHLEITGPTGSVFVEIKATTTSQVRMSVKQVGEAIPHKDNYFLCVVASSDTSLDVEAFKAKARFVVDIGERFKNLWSEFLSMKLTMDLTQKTEGGLAIELSGQQVKFRVDEHVWTAGLDFPATIALLKFHLLAQTPPVPTEANPHSQSCPDPTKRNPMSFYRFVTQAEIDRIRQAKALLPQGHYPPYRPNEITCVLESENPQALCARYGRTLAEQRAIPVGAKLIIIQIIGFTGRIESDRSQTGWPESRAILDPIPSTQISIVAEATVTDLRGDQVSLGTLQILTPGLSLA